MGQHPSAPSANVAAFIRHVALVLTVAAVVFPPFTSMNGTEYAFVLTGPEWSQALVDSGSEFGLRARIHWSALGVQLAVIWAIALGARWHLAHPGRLGARAERAD